MNELFYNPYFIGIGAVLILAVFWVSIKYWPKKKLCARCQKKKTMETDEQGLPICDNCYKFAILEKAKIEQKVLFCPVDGEPMHKHLIEDARNVIVDSCPKCGRMIINRKDIRKITILNLDFIPKLPFLQE
jgi:hypothetical protein